LPSISISEEDDQFAGGCFVDHNGVNQRSKSPKYRQLYRLPRIPCAFEESNHADLVTEIFAAESGLEMWAGQAKGCKRGMVVKKFLDQVYGIAKLVLGAPKF